MSAGHARCGPRGRSRSASPNQRGRRLPPGGAKGGGSLARESEQQRAQGPLRTQAAARAPSRRGHWPHAGFPRSPASRLHVTRVDALFRCGGGRPQPTLCCIFRHNIYKPCHGISRGDAGERGIWLKQQTLEIRV